VSDKQLHVFKLDRNLHSPVHSPGDYVFIPSTLSDDGDPRDVLVPDPSFPGYVQEVRPSASSKCSTRASSTKRSLPSAKTTPTTPTSGTTPTSTPNMLREITHFFSIYKDLEGKRVEIKGWHDDAYARDRVTRAARQFLEHKAKQQPQPVP
jgi:inorganic pyrophosphatase